MKPKADVPAAVEQSCAVPAPAVEAWVPVRDRLPEPETRVLVLGRDGSMGSYYLPQGRPEHWYPGCWHINWTTHWMPLPPPPKESR